jgi:hypothetical protein
MIAVAAELGLEFPEGLGGSRAEGERGRPLREFEVVAASGFQTLLEGGTLHVAVLIEEVNQFGNLSREDDLTQLADILKLDGSEGMLAVEGFEKKGEGGIEGKDEWPVGNAGAVPQTNFPLAFEFNGKDVNGPEFGFDIPRGFSHGMGFRCRLAL